MKISVIVPVYKVEPYLRRCVDSILNQTHRELEIILVDDGSPDSCPSICDRYAEQDSRVCVIHKQNGGLSDARNAGLERATGDWISFIDSDDWIEPDMYQCLLKNAEQFEAQISVGGVNDELMDGDRIRVFKTTATDREIREHLTPIEAMHRHLDGSWAAWDKIYRREIFEGIRYPVGEINEDEPIMLLLMDRCQRVAYTNRVFYHYIHRADSITTTSFSAKKLAWVKHCKENLDWVREHHPELEDAALRRLAGSLTWALREMALSDAGFNAEIKSVKQDVKDYYRQTSRLALRRELRVRLFCGRYVPFGVYRILERMLAARGKRKAERT